MIRIIPLALAATFLPALLASDQNQLDGNPTLFSVVTAYTVASGGDAAASASDHPLRAAVIKHLSARKIPVLPELQQFFSAHRKKDPGADFAQYISFALASGEPPEFTARFEGHEVPPDVQGLLALQPLLVRFYREAELGDLWRKVQGHYEKEIERYHGPVSRAVLEANAYLRNPTSGYMGRRFYVILELLAPANQVHTRSYKDDYYIVVAPSPELRAKEVRHAYLHYLLDPLATKFADRINKRWPLIDIALGAPALEESYKSDFLLLTTESLIRAVESRMDSEPQQARDALREGFILTPFFGEQLPVYEKQQVGMRLYLPEILDKIDLATESKRLEKVEFAAAKTGRAPAARVTSEVTLSPVESELEAADKLYGSRQLEPARLRYGKLLTLTDDRRIHARSYYGLARIAILERNLDVAEQHFRRALELSPDPHTAAWSQVYLGRLYENTETPKNALQYYKAALGIEGAPAGARQAAEEAIKKLSR